MNGINGFTTDLPEDNLAVCLQTEAQARKKIGELLEFISSIDTNKDGSLNFYSELLEFGKQIRELGLCISVCNVNNKVKSTLSSTSKIEDVIIGINEPINILCEQPISNILNNSIIDLINILNIDLSQIIGFIKSQYMTLSGDTLEIIGFNIIKNIKIILELKSKLN